MITAFLASIILGFSKAGFKGLGILVVTLFALVFTPKQSTGTLMPLLVLADIFAIITYRHHVDWKTLFRLIPWMIIGVLIAVFVGSNISEHSFRKIMAVIIIISALMMMLWDRINKGFIPKSIWFAGIMGLGAGFTTMLGNLAGAFANLFFLAMKFPKTKFIGTAAWLFFFINIFKIPFHVFVWKTIHWSSLKTDLILAPGVIIGFFLGLHFIQYLSNHQFKYYIISVTIIGGIVILIQ